MDDKDDDDYLEKARDNDKIGWIIFGVIIVIAILLAYAGHWNSANDNNTSPSGLQSYCDKNGC